jgi:hypothetical protein
MSTVRYGEKPRLSGAHSGTGLDTISIIANQNTNSPGNRGMFYPPFGIPVMSRCNIIIVSEKIVVPAGSNVTIACMGAPEVHSSRFERSVLLHNTFKLILLLSQRNIDFIMIRTKDKNYHQILVDGKTYSELHLRYGASRSFNEVITEILRHHESAISIIADCESCKSKFKAAIQK